MKSRAFGAPGIEPRWTRADKEAVVTAYSVSSPVWASVGAGIVNEVYFPTIDRPQVRDLQFLVTDGETFFDDERRNTQASIEQLGEDSLGYRVVTSDYYGRYQIEKKVIAAPHAACLLLQVKFNVAPRWRKKLRLYALLAPHLAVGGRGNNAELVRHHDRLLLTAHRGNDHLVMDCSCGFKRASCGYVGHSDGWTDLAGNQQMDWQFELAEDGNVALIGEINVPDEAEFTLALGFGYERHGAVVAAAESLSIPFASHWSHFQRQWQQAGDDRDDSLATHSQDGGRLYRTSHNLLLAHEDKTYKGATIASLSIPWGQARTEDDLGGYHLFWPRDAVNAAVGLMATGQVATPFRTLIYLSVTQRQDGGFHQNCWIDGKPYWTGIQLDEVAYPILLAWRLKQADALQQLDPYPMVRAAASYLIREGPATPQDRWEEGSGLSPSTLAVHIAALICAAEFAGQRGEQNLADYLVQYADFLEQHIERWTVTDQGTLLETVPRHFIRLLPSDPASAIRPDDPNTAEIELTGLPPEAHHRFPARDVISTGFLELVRYGIRPAGDPLIEDSLKAVDKVLKVDMPSGPCWHRYNHDGYGQQANGEPFRGSGQGRAWPLLTVERAHYEFAAGRDVQSHVDAIESFAGVMGLLPEQMWDQPESPNPHLTLGSPTDTAMPLVWAHAEYTKLLRSLRDGRVFDRIEPVYQRYVENPAQRERLEIWKLHSQPRAMLAEDTLRIQADASFQMRWTNDDWHTVEDTPSVSVDRALHYVDLTPDVHGGRSLQFTFCWLDDNRWEKQNFTIDIQRSTNG